MDDLAELWRRFRAAHEQPLLEALPGKGPGHPSADGAGRAGHCDHEALPSSRKWPRPVLVRRYLASVHDAPPALTVAGRLPGLWWVRALLAGALLVNNAIGAIAARATPDGGRITLADRELTERARDGASRVTHLRSHGELVDVLARHFGIAVPAGAVIHWAGLDWSA